jgi:hypothetical protein
MALLAGKVLVLPGQFESGELVIEAGCGLEVFNGVARLALLPKLAAVLVRVTGLAGGRDGQEPHGLPIPGGEGAPFRLVAAPTEEFDVSALENEARIGVVRKGQLTHAETSR